MAREGKGKIIAKQGASTLYLSISAKVASDSAFPFKPGEEVTVRVTGGGLAVAKRRRTRRAAEDAPAQLQEVARAGANPPGTTSAPSKNKSPDQNSFEDL